MLRQLRPAITGAARTLQWWDTLIVPNLRHLAKEKGLAVEARSLLLDILAYDTDDGDNKNAAYTSALLSEKVLEIWLKNSTKTSSDAEPAAHFIEEQMKLVLIEFGKKRPKVIIH
jgi:solute carrier family 25 (mitochondrial carrier protein), member 16